MRCKNHRSQIVGGYKIRRELSVSSGTHTGVLHVLTKQNNIDERYITLRKFTRECQLLLRGFNYLLLYFTYLHTANLTVEVLKMPFKQKSGIQPHARNARKNCSEMQSWGPARVRGGTADRYKLPDKYFAKLFAERSLVEPLLGFTKKSPEPEQNWYPAGERQRYAIIMSRQWYFLQ